MYLILLNLYTRALFNTRESVYLILPSLYILGLIKERNQLNSSKWYNSISFIVLIYILIRLASLFLLFPGYSPIRTG